MIEHYEEWTDRQGNHHLEIVKDISYSYPPFRPRRKEEKKIVKLTWKQKLEMIETDIKETGWNQLLETNRDFILSLIRVGKGDEYGGSILLTNDEIDYYGLGD